MTRPLMTQRVSQTGGESMDSIIFIYCLIQTASKQIYVMKTLSSVQDWRWLAAVGRVQLNQWGENTHLNQKKKKSFGVQ